MAWVGKNLKIMFLPSCQGQRHLPLDQVAQNFTQLGLKQLQTPWMMCPQLLWTTHPLSFSPWRFMKEGYDKFIPVLPQIWLQFSSRYWLRFVRTAGWSINLKPSVSSAQINSTAFVGNNDHASLLWWQRNSTRWCWMQFDFLLSPSGLKPTYFTFC